MSEYRVGQILRIGHYDWRVRRIIGRTVAIERIANDGRVFSKVCTMRELNKMGV